MTKTLARNHARLGKNLRSLRSRAGLGGVEAGRRAGMSQAKVSRIENCRFVPTVDDVRALCQVYGASGEERDELVQLAVAVRDESKRARIVLPRGAAQLQSSYARMEDRASLVRTFCPTVVPGLLQTADYVRAIFADEITGDDLDEVVAARTARRRQVFASDGGKQLVVVMSEGALRWQLGSPAPMAEQVDAIIEATRIPSVRVGIIPWTTAVPTICTHSFDLYDATAVVVGTEVAAATFTEHDDVQLYVDLFGQLEQVAVFGEDARRELARIGGEYRLLS